VYVGDTARFPYGPRAPEEIRRFALEIADLLVHRDVKMLVVACNSVEVSAIGDIAARAGIPVVGVIDPAVRTAVHATRSGTIGMIGTQATVASGAYDRAVAATGADVRLLSAACPVFVEHVERGDTTSDELRTAARRYLEPLREGGIDTLILGCTHYPLLSGLLQMELGPEVVLVSSAEETAKDVYGCLLREGLQRDDAAPPEHTFLATGDPDGFQRVAEVFLGPELTEVRAAHAEPVGGGAWS
jgi:glutamate racemase